MQQVQVRGPGAVQQRRDDVLGRIVVGREELQRFGDTTLSGALKRQPGLSISGNQIRMRGLGNGYTQILIDGEPAPIGFTIDMLSPDLIERIEIQRSAQADASAQAVAGSINIIMRKASGAARRTLKLAGEQESDAFSPAATLRWTRQTGAAAYALTATVNESRRREQPTIDERFSDAEGTSIRRFDEQDDNRMRKLSLAPRIDLKLDGGDTLAWQGLVDLSRTDSRGAQQETTLQGRTTASPDSDWRAVYDTWIVKSDLTWTHRVDSSRLTAKAGFEASGRDGDYLFHGIDAAGTLWLNRAVQSGAFERRVNTSGKYVAPLAHGHDIAVGWDAAATRRSESRLQRDTGPAGSGALPFHTLDQDYSATVGRVALFAQDEWALSERLQAYLGLRWEGLDTRTNGRDFSGASTMSRVWSPVAQAVWKLPDSSRNQLRVSLARTYKAPLPRDLVPRRYTVNNDNGPASPDYQGNPLLRPELAWGLDAALESYFAHDAMLSVSAYARRIRDVMLLQVWQENGVWVSMPANGGSASVQGIELDARAPIPALHPGWPTFDLRANLGRNWSRLDGISGPDNRLAAQAPLTLNLGADMRMASGMSSGANLHMVGGYRARTAQALTEASGVLRELEAYAAWQAGDGQWRLGFANLLHRPRHNGQVYDDGTTASTRLFNNPRHLAVRLQYETRL
ncbi:TonB-dependent receptor [Massilia horti]|uniref:TonB-dependent receptor n=1 Tax=Massilia horti TaxID=2562153 RepID=A0A4Y9T8C3_9BURK|nr:TonB-dependent receptor [Massilia horti]